MTQINNLNNQNVGKLVFTYKAVLENLNDDTNLDDFEKRLNGLQQLVQFQKAGRLEKTEEGYTINIVDMDDTEIIAIENMFLVMNSKYPANHLQKTKAELLKKQ